MAVQSQLPVLAIIGDAGVGKRTLLSRITSRLAAPGTSTVWDIDTRYYNASVQCEVLETAQANPLTELEGVMLVCNADQQGSFRSCQQWASRADLASAEVRLFVANQFDRLQSGHGPSADSDDGESWTQTYKEWCSEHYFEYIEVNARNLHADARLAARDGEQQGVRRVISALHAHTWPGLQLKSQGPPAGQSYAGACINAVGLWGLMGLSALGQDLSIAGEVAQPYDRDEERMPEPGSQDNSSPADNPADELLPSIAVNGPLHARLQQPSNDIMPSHQATDGENGEPGVLETEEDLDNFERVLNQAATAREHLQSLPDEQRREAAARMAVHFAQVMGMDESDDDSASDTG